MKPNILWKKHDDNYVDIFTIQNPVLDVTKAKLETQTLFDNEKAKHVKNENTATNCLNLGKSHLQNNDYFNAMLAFNRTLKVIPTQSQQIGLAYDHRSSCFLHLNMPEQCMFDILSAKSTNRPSAAASELDERFAKCMNLLVDDDFKSNRFIPVQPKLSFNEHEEYAGVAECLDIQSTGVIATRELNIGETILIESPYAIYASRLQQSTCDRCNNCFKGIRNFITCQTCCGPVFCDENCMDKSLHQYSCILPDVSDIGLVLCFHINAAFPDFDMLKTTVELLLKGETPSGLDEAQKKFCLVFKLNIPAVTDELLKMFTEGAATVIGILMQVEYFKIKFTTSEHHRFLQHLVLHLFHIAEKAVGFYEYCFSNTVTMKELKYQFCAMGMYSIGSRISNSCEPNVLWYFSDGRLVCRVISTIKKGEELLRSYYPYRDVLAEQLFLSSRPHIKCKCDLCSVKIHTATPMTIARDERFQDVFKAGDLTIKGFRELSRESVVLYEHNAIEFLKYYQRYKSAEEYLLVQNLLLAIWNVLSSRY